MFSPFLKPIVPRSYELSKASPLAMTLSFISTGTVLGVVAFSTVFLGLCSEAVAQSNSTRVDLSNQAEFTYESAPQTGYSDPPLEFRGKTARIQESFDRLIDPLGRIVGCAGETLPTYAGFSVSFYDADPTDPTGASLGRLTSMTRTEFPDIPNNGIPAGIGPNTENNNAYFITDGTNGTYNFLLDPSKGQLDLGRAYKIGRASCRERV